VHDYFILLDCSGALARMHEALYVAVREATGREASPTAAIIDSQSARAAPTYGPPRGKWRRSSGSNCLHKRIRPFGALPLAKMESRASWSS
jgi:hypothetical protein